MAQSNSGLHACIGGELDSGLYDCISFVAKPSQWVAGMHCAASPHSGPHACITWLRSG